MGRKVFRLIPLPIIPLPKMALTSHEPSPPSFWLRLCCAMGLRYPCQGSRPKLMRAGVGAMGHFRSAKFSTFAGTS
jgi:hypothetical protein